MRRPIAVAAATIAVGAGAILAGAAPAGATPTCAGVGGLVNHGQHIVGAYVVGVGGLGSSLEWAPAGSVGSAIGGSGASLPGAAGRKQHAAAPGASFCTDSASPGAHL